MTRITRDNAFQSPATLIVLVAKETGSPTSADPFMSLVRISTGLTATRTALGAISRSPLSDRHRFWRLARFDRGAEPGWLPAEARPGDFSVLRVVVFRNA